MRTREEIENDRTYRSGYTTVEYSTIKSLEVLLDIRELLMPQITRQDHDHTDKLNDFDLLK